LEKPRIVEKLRDKKHHWQKLLVRVKLVHLLKQTRPLKQTSLAKTKIAKRALRLTTETA